MLKVGGLWLCNFLLNARQRKSASEGMEDDSSSESDSDMWSYSSGDSGPDVPDLMDGNDSDRSMPSSISGGYASE